jgi:sulfate ABC transporter permease protein CysT
MSAVLAPSLPVAPVLPKRKPRRVLPGFGLSLGYTLVYLSLLVLIPLSAVFLKTATLGWEKFWNIVNAPSVVASHQLSFGASLLAAGLNTVFGLLLAWSLVRYSFPGKKLVDTLIDLPFALPTAVAGIALTALYAGNGWLGSLLEPLGVLVALTFIGLPFVVRTVQPVLEDIDTELEEAAASLGAHRWQTFRHVVFPILTPAPHVGGPVVGPGVPTVLIGALPAAVLGDSAVCVGPPDAIVAGSATVLIGGRPAARLGDATAHGGSIVLGCPTVMIGG